MNKTVYVLGAGFSIEAGAPSQENLVQKIFDVHKQNSHHFHDGCFAKFVNFLTNILLIPKEMHSRVPLEDIFTPLDRCILDNVSFRELSPDGIVLERENLYYLIGRTLEILLQSNKNKEYINKFAKYLVSKASTRIDGKYKIEDPVSVISTNWDILLDNSIKDCIDNDYKNKAVVDYCCYISSFQKEDQSVMPGLEMLGRGGFNVKLLKLHGSLNWLQCPRCQRVYIDFYNKIAINHIYNKVSCRHCKNNFKKDNESHNLVSNLVMPTFLKNLSNPQYKLIWQNAAIELSEANHIVFIGYSLPQADFEMRQLLARMVREDALIEVVDYLNQNDKDGSFKKMKDRYLVFFGKRKVTFHSDGASKYIENLLGTDEGVLDLFC
jgi:hypothetical protein